MTQDNYCIPCGLVSEVCSEGAIVLPSERVLSGSEGRLLYGPEFNSFLGSKFQTRVAPKLADFP